MYCSAAQVVLFAHGHRQSSWHSTNALDYNVDRVRWEAVPGFAVKAQLYSATATKVCMHQQADMPGCLVSSVLHLQVALLKGPRPCQQWLGPSAVSGLKVV